VDVACSPTGCPPVDIKANGIHGGEALISGKISSQYLSALLMASPLASSDITIKIKDKLMSAPYVHLTMNLMRKFGAECESEDDLIFRVKPGKYISPKSVFIEGETLI
jgi:3-phosphoshikimate 1-carboxyvinyltransferase